MNQGRDGYTVALFAGYEGVFVGDSVPAEDRCVVLVEMYEQHKLGEDFLTYHYRAHDLVSNRACEHKTIGHVEFDPAGARVPPRIVTNQFLQCSWRRLR